MPVTDAEWEKYGRTEPYFGVLSHKKYLRENLDPSLLDEFFQSGKSHVEEVLATIRKRLDSSFRPRTALDFGCGVGRLVVPLSSLCDSVTGVDVSPSMLEEAKRNCTARGVANARFVLSDDDLVGLEGKFDLVHSVLVFQHIPVARGEKILDRLMRMLNPGGVGVLHVPYHNPSRIKKWIGPFRRRIPAVNWAVNVLMGRKWNLPLMEMNHYELGRIFSVLQGSGCRGAYADFVDDGGHLGVFLYFQAVGESQGRPLAATTD